MSAEPKAAYDDLNIRTITIVGIVSAILASWPGYAPHPENLGAQADT